MTENTVYHRLHTDSIKRQHRLTYTAKYERAPEENAHWRTVLSANNCLSIPQIRQCAPPLQTDRLQYNKHHKSQSSLTAFQLISNFGLSGTRHVAFPAHQLHDPKAVSKSQEKSQTKFWNENQRGTINIPKIKRSKKIDMYSNESIMNEPIIGVSPFPLPQGEIPTSFEMVPCKSSLVAFYDMQGTY